MSLRNPLRSLASSSICASCRVQLTQLHPAHLGRAFTSSTIHRANDTANTNNTPRNPPPQSEDAMSGILARMLEDTRKPRSPPSAQDPTTQQRTTTGPSLMDLLGPDLLDRSSTQRYMPGGVQEAPNPSPHHLHIFAQKHNTHITLTRPDKSPIVSLSAGNIGFRKAQRGSYDAAFQLAAYVLRNIQERGLLRPSGGGYSNYNAAFPENDALPAAGTKGKAPEPPIRRVEIVWRGFGHGREAVTKALLGNEGRGLRRLVVGVSDGTRLKFGGTRGMNPRRLG